MTEKVFCLVPLPITSAMISSSTIAEPASGEAVYVSGTTYAIGALVISTTTHRVYQSLQNSNVGHDPTVLANSAWWQDIGPTQKWAPFDNYTSTAATGVTTLSYVLLPGFVNAIALYGIVGASVSIVVKDTAGGTIIYSNTVDVYEGAAGWYEYFFTTPKQKTKIVLTDLPLRPDPEITITVSASSGVTVSLGMLVIGDMRNLLDSAEWGGTTYGATSEPTTYSYIKADDFGNVTIKRRYSATNINIKVAMPQQQADYALQTLQGMLDTPAAWVATDRTGYQGLNVFGLASGSLSYDGPTNVSLNIKVAGMI